MPLAAAATVETLDLALSGPMPDASRLRSREAGNVAIRTADGPASAAAL